MSATAKTEAKAKLDKLKIEIGAPKRDLDYSVQPMGRGSFGGNMLIASTWRHREEMKRIGRGNADRRWDVLPQQPALAYDIAQNRLIVTAAMLQAPVLDMAQDTARNTARSARWSDMNSPMASTTAGAWSMPLQPCATGGRRPMLPPGKRAPGNWSRNTAPIRIRD